MVNYVASRIDKTDVSPVFHIFEVKKSISDTFTEVLCLRDLENLEQLPVLLPILAFNRGYCGFGCIYFCYFVILDFFDVKESIFVSFTKLPCLGDLINPNQLPVFAGARGY